MTGELKKMAITMLQEYVKGFQEKRKEVSDEVMRKYMTPRELEWKGNPNPNPKPKEVKGKKEKGETNEGKEKEIKS
jgi:tryptophanyl-tRNA synthetase